MPPRRSLARGVRTSMPALSAASAIRSVRRSESARIVSIPTDESRSSPTRERSAGRTCGVPEAKRRAVGAYSLTSPNESGSSARDPARRCGLEPFQQARANVEERNLRQSTEPLMCAAEDEVGAELFDVDRVPRRSNW